MSRYGRKRISRRDVLKAAGGMVLAGAALGGCAYALQAWDDRQSAASVSGTGETDDHRAPPELREVTYGHKTYRQRPELESYLFLGIDQMGKAVGTQSYVAGGQADTQMLLVLDNAAKTWRILQINRDSMVEVPVLSMMGTVPYTLVQQICLAHAYGDGREQSCQNNVRAVSMMLDDQPINGYLSLNMGGVGILVDLMGGITVKVTSDFSAVDPALTEGQTILSQQPSMEVAIMVPGVEEETRLAAVCWNRSGQSQLVPVRVQNGVVYLSVRTSGPVMLLVRVQGA